MVGAIGTSTLYAGNYAAASLGGLEAQLEQYKSKLADWENCPSCKTAEGKAKIAEISGKIGELKARMEVVEASRQSKSVSEAGAEQATDRDKVHASAAANTDQRKTSAAAQSSVATVGSRLDIFA